MTDLGLRNDGGLFRCKFSCSPLGEARAGMYWNSAVLDVAQQARQILYHCTDIGTVKAASRHRRHVLIRPDPGPDEGPVVSADTTDWLCPSSSTSRSVFCVRQLACCSTGLSKHC